MHTFTKIAVYLLMLNFLAENMGSFTRGLNDFLALGLLGSFVLMYFPVKLRTMKPSQSFWVLFLFVISVLIFIQGDIYKLIAASVFVLALNQLLLSLARKELELYALFWATIFYIIFVLAYEYFSPVWLATRQLSKFVMVLINALVPYSVDYGTTYMGLKITISFFLFSLAILLLSKNRRFLLFAFMVISSILINIAHVVLHSYLSMKMIYLFPWLSTKLLDGQIILFSLLLPFTYVYLKLMPLKDYSLGVGPKKISWLILIAIVATLFALEFPFPCPQCIQPGKIVFHDEGYLNWDMPVFGRYGSKTGGMFGMLPEYLSANNYDVTIGAISEESLVDADTLVLINLNRMLTKSEKQLIWNFVRKGGSLLVLGEHTGATNIRMPYNDLLSPVNIAFNFDSAISIVEKWAHAFEFRPHYINSNLKDENDLQIWIGASLRISHPARPVIIGKYAFSDPGNKRAVNRAYLGDMKYSPGERLGDLILVAENDYGEGKVLVFGDTSSFQNTALVQSSEFVAQVFQWLNVRGKGPHPDDTFLLTIILVLAVVILATQKASARLIASSLLSVCTLTFLATVMTQNTDTAEKRKTELEMAYIDTSHLERVNLDSWGEQDGLGGLTFNLIRNGYFPKVLRKFDPERISISDLLIIIAPAKPFSVQEIECLGKFVRRGGRIILTVGWEEKAPSQELLQYFNCDIDNTPLGRVSPDQNIEGLTFNEAWPVIHNQENTEVLCQVWDYPVVVYKRHFKGGVLLIGDSSFLLNRNLEGFYYHFLSNIMFIKKVIRERLKKSSVTS
jgi:hypothetical protein